MKKFYISIFILFIFSLGYSQDYKRMISEGTHTVAAIQAAAEVHFEQIGTGRGTGYKPYKRWEYQALRSMDETGMLKSPEFYLNELENYNSYLNNNASLSRTTVGTWEQLGPLEWNQTSGWNPGVGRVTSIATETGNPDHIIIGANTGGVWKSLDGGGTWTALTDNLSNLNVYALTIDPTDASVYYWGANSGIIFKSEDAGATWNLLADVGAGFVNKILVDPTNVSKMYCSVEFGGIFKSVDGGTSWSLIENSVTNGYDIEFKANDTNTIFASGENYYISTDGGDSFSILEAGLGPWSENYIVGANNWSVASSNQNNTVTPKTGEAMGIFYIGDFSSPITQLISPVLDLSSSSNPQLQFSFTNVNWGGDLDTLRVLYKTSASGEWLELENYTTENSFWNDVTINLPNPTSTYYIAFEATANYGRGLTLDDVLVEDVTAGIIFEDGFENATNGFGNGPKMVGVSPADPETVYVLEAANGSFSGLFKSVDGGNNFERINHSGRNYFGYSSDSQDPDDSNRGQAPRDMDIAIHPNDINDVHIAGINTWRSTDGGTSFNITSQWTPYGANIENIGYCHADIDMLQFIEDKLYVGSDGGIFVAENPTEVNTEYYTDLTTGLGIRQFYKIGISQTDPVIVTGGSQDNGTSVYGTDGIWRDWLGADGMESFVDKNNSDILFGTSQNGSLYKSLNSGVGYFGIGSPENKSGNWITPFEQDPNIPNTIYTGYDQVYKSSDGGFNWVSVSQNFGGNLNHLKLAPSNGNFQYAARGNALYKNTFVGAISNWTQLTGFSGSVNSIAIHPSNPNKIAIATTGNQKVYVSDDAGNSWTSYQLNLPNFSAQALVWEDNGLDGLYLGMNYGVYYIDNENTEWQPFSNNLPNVIISELEINYVNNKIYAATYGRGLWVSNVYDETLSTENFELNSLVVFPNPANDVISLKWDKGEEVSIKIFNALGKVMYYNKNQDLQNDLSIDISSFASGLYFIKVNTVKGSVTKKVIVE